MSLCRCAGRGFFIPRQMNEQKKQMYESRIELYRQLISDLDGAKETALLLISYYEQEIKKYIESSNDHSIITTQ